MATRTVKQVINGMATSDGAGVKLLRSLGQSQTLRLDPFLMLDEFSSENADDYIAGFPDHPHRGFETVTYILDGHMLHSDHLGNTGNLKSGGAQWMTAGRGIIHSEMPQQDSGRMRGFQCWINLPSKEKMKPAAYQDIQAEDIPVLNLQQGGQVKIIAGTTTIEHQTISGPIQGLTTEVLFLDVHLTAGSVFTIAVAENHNIFVYPYEGQVETGVLADRQSIITHTAAILTQGDRVEMAADKNDVRFILLSGRPIGEPIVQYGPFVMNTRDEIEQTLADYRNGRLVAEQ